VDFDHGKLRKNSWKLWINDGEITMEVDVLDDGLMEAILQSPVQKMQIS